MTLPTPYYDRDGITIYHADCRKILPLIEPGSVDLVLTDPPFYTPASYYTSRKVWQRSWSELSPLKIYWEVILRAIIPCISETGHFMTFCNGESYAVFYPEIYGYFNQINCLVWDKGIIGMGNLWRRQHELVIAARWSTSYIPKRDDAVSDVVRYAPVTSRDRNHPAEKPIDLISHLICAVTKKTSAVLDPFMGSGTTLRAAKDLGRRAIGIEIEEKYCEIAVERLRQEVLPL